MTTTEMIELNHGVRARIVDDAAWARDPRRDQDNLGVMVCWHRRYRLGDVHDCQSPHDWVMGLLRELDPAKLRPFVVGALRQSRFERDAYRRFMQGLDRRKRVALWGDYLERRQVSIDFTLAIDILTHHGWTILPLYLYDHGGITLRTNPSAFRAQDPGRWDWGLVGWIYAGPAEIERMGTPPERVGAVLRVEVEEYDLYLRGEVYTAIIDTPDRAGVESCGGLAGMDQARVMAIELARPFEARYGDVQRILGEGI